MAFPVLFGRQFWPDIGERTLLALRWSYELLPIPLAGAAITTTWFIGYPPSPVEWTGMAVAMGLRIALTYAYLPRLRGWHPLGSFRPRPRLAAVAVLFFVVGQIGIFSTPSLGMAAPVVFGLVAARFLGFLLFATSQREDPAGDRARFAFALGGAAFYVALSPISEFFDGRVGLGPIDGAFLGYLIWLYRKRAGSGSAVPGGPTEATTTGAGST
jgi:hypothetical protein